MNIRDTIKQMIRDALGQQAAVRYGTVANVDSKMHRVKVTLQPEGTLTPWLPVLTQAAGAGWGFAMHMDVGMQVALTGTHGSNSDLLVMGAVHSSVDMPPAPPNAIGTGGTASTTSAPAVAGEAVLTHKSGATLRLCADGSVYIKGALRLDGTLTANGDVFDRHGSLDRLRGNYDAHVHGNVQNGGGQTGTTSAPDPE